MGAGRQKITVMDILSGAAIFLNRWLDHDINSANLQSRSMINGYNNTGNREYYVILCLFSIICKNWASQIRLTQLNSYLEFLDHLLNIKNNYIVVGL